MSHKGEYFWGIGAFVLGAAGMSENITSGRGSFIVSAIVFSIGFGLILWSYRR